jgi:hypothetical protein
MSGRICENILHNPFCQFPGDLILFLDNPYPRPGFHISPVLDIHIKLAPVDKLPALDLWKAAQSFRKLKRWTDDITGLHAMPLQPAGLWSGETNRKFS